MKHTPLILVLADDLTGAIEVGAKFAACGIAAMVTTELSLCPAGIDDNIQALVIDAETRHMPPGDAARAVYQLALAANERGVPYLYKKTDSTLRGNIGSELAAAAAAFANSPVVYAPAYPEMGRAVKEGRLYVYGRLVNETEFAADRLNPIAESHIPALLAAQCTLPIFSASAATLQTARAPGIYLCDGETNAHLLAIARAFLQSGTPALPALRLAAGPAGLAQFIAESVDWPRTQCCVWPAARNCLVVNGSPHEVSIAQVRHAEANGFRPMAEPLPYPATRDGPVAHAGALSGWLILNTDRDGRGCPFSLEAAKRTGGAVRGILRRTELDALVVFGGDTAHGVIRALGDPPIHPLGEVLPGVPISRIEPDAIRSSVEGRQRDLYLITKAGGFGPIDILALLRERLSAPARSCEDVSYQ